MATARRGHGAAGAGTIARALGERRCSSATAGARGATRLRRGHARAELQLPDADRKVSGSWSRLFPPASRMQRAAADLTRRALDRPRQAPVAPPRGVAGSVPSVARRRRHRQSPAQRQSSITTTFVRVEGDGVHEIAVGPVHAGIIEPGHFRFSVVGEKVLRLEERLGYVHKGIERRFTELRHHGRTSAGGARLGRFRGRVLLGLLPGARGLAASSFRRARRGCGPSASNSNGSPITSAISGRSATMLASRSDSPSSPDSRSS